MIFSHDPNVQRTSRTLFAHVWIFANNPNPSLAFRTLSAQSGIPDRYPTGPVSCRAFRYCAARAAHLSGTFRAPWGIPERPAQFRNDAVPRTSHALRERYPGALESHCAPLAQFAISPAQSGIFPRAPRATRKIAENLAVLRIAPPTFRETPEYAGIRPPNPSNSSAITTLSYLLAHPSRTLGSSRALS